MSVTFRRFVQVFPSRALALACLVAPPPALAAAPASGHAERSASPGSPREQARVLADRGADAFAHGQFARAHALFVQAYALVPAPTVALFEARALVSMKRFVAARAAYQRAARAELDQQAPEAFRAAVKDARTELVALEQRIPRYRIVVDSASDASRWRVKVDGELVPGGERGSFAFADPGRHRVEVSGESGAPAVEHFTLQEGDRTTVTIDKAPSSAPARTWGFVALGAGAVGLGLGVTAGFVALDAHRDAERRCPDGVCVRGGAGARDLDRFERYRTLSTVGYAVGALGAGAGAVLLFGSSSSSSPRFTLTSSLLQTQIGARY